MAIKCNYEFGDGLYPNAYFMIRKITLGNSDEEYFEQDKEGFDILKFNKVKEAHAYVFVYGDQIAREKSVRPINAFGVPFEYDEDTDGNVFKIAYEALKNTQTIQNGVWEDV